MKKLAFSLLAALYLCACTPSEKTNGIENGSDQINRNTTGSVIRLDPMLDDLIPKDAVIEVLASGFTWSEGPVWVPSLNALLFSDVPENNVYKWSEPDSLSEYLNPSGYTGQAKGKEGANGLLLDQEGKLILCQHGDRRLARMSAPLESPDENYETIIAQFGGKKFNSPNDVAQGSDGTFFFTDPPYGLKDDDKKELDFQGVYKVDSEGNVALLIDSLSFPNGVALSPDQNTLYIAVSDPKKARYYAYELDENNNIVDGKILLDVTTLVGKERPGSPDGLCVHSSGNLFATGPGGVLVITPEGKHLGTISTGQPTANCTFNKDQSELYMTANMHLMRIRL